MAKKPTKQKALDPTLPIYQLKISLQHIDPPIWRRVQTDDCSLDELHEIIQVAMGWDDMHIYAFVIDGEEYGNLQTWQRMPNTILASFASARSWREGHAHFRYDYDFGDDWKHVIEIEKTLPAEEGVHYPRCVKGERACPPEDCGGSLRLPVPFGKTPRPQPRRT